MRNRDQDFLEPFLEPLLVAAFEPFLVVLTAAAFPPLFDAADADVAPSPPTSRTVEMAAPAIFFDFVTSILLGERRNMVTNGS